MRRSATVIGALLSAALLAACGGGKSFLSSPLQSVGSQPASGLRPLHPVRNAGWTEAVLYSFAGGSDGAVPANEALIAVNGTLYGATRGGGGSGCGGGGCGTVFKVSTSGAESVIHRFKGAPNDGQNAKGGLVERNGVLYGTTQNGGGYYSGGTFFKITTSGKETVLHSFGGANDGSNPYGRLIYVPANDTFYGTTLGGGSSSCACGTVFSVTPSGKETVLHSFAGARTAISSRGACSMKTVNYMARPKSVEAAVARRAAIATVPWGAGLSFA